MLKLHRRKIIIGISIAVALIIAVLMLLSEKIDKTVLLIDHVHVEKLSDIRPVDDSLVIPVLYDNLGILGKLSTEERKKKFIDVMLPAILIYRHQLAQRRDSVKILLEKSRYGAEWTPADSAFIKRIFNDYKTKNMQELINRMKPPPVSLVLTQAAIESGWGSSRFFREANNVFGIWSYNKSDERIIAGTPRNGNNIYLKKYDNLLGSIENYHLLLARSRHYEDFRDCLQRGDNVFELIWYLRPYSEKGYSYVILLRNVLVANDLLRYDRYRLHPDYFDYPKDEDAIF